MQQCDVFRVDPYGTRQGRIGRVSLDDASRLTLVQAEGGAEGDLREAITEMNQAGELVLKHPEPAPEEGSRDRVRKTPVSRGAPDFMDALQDNLRRWHSMELDIGEG